MCLCICPSLIASTSKIIVLEVFISRSFVSMTAQSQFMWIEDSHLVIDYYLFLLRCLAYWLPCSYFFWSHGSEIWIWSSYAGISLEVTFVLIYSCSFGSASVKLPQVASDHNLLVIQSTCFTALVILVEINFYHFFQRKMCSVTASAVSYSCISVQLFCPFFEIITINLLSQIKSFLYNSNQYL